jgi:hypothetical protein
MLDNLVKEALDRACEEVAVTASSPMSSVG